MNDYNYLALDSTKRILEKIAANNGLLTWYNIVKSIDTWDMKQTPPPFYVLKELTKLGYLRVEPNDGGNNAKYWLTDGGYDLLSQI